MKNLALLTLTLPFTLLSAAIAQDNSPKRCLTLEDTHLSERVVENTDAVLRLKSGALFNFAISHDGQKAALYQVFDAQQKATFTLYDTQTGKQMLKRTLSDFEERSHQTRLKFSPSDNIVYLEGMSYPAHDASTNDAMGAVPFWNIKTDKLVFSPCATAMGVRDVQFSDDETVAYVQTVDSFHSLCSTEAVKAIELKGQTSNAGYRFDPKAKLFVDEKMPVEATSEMDEEAYQEFIEGIVRVDGGRYQIKHSDGSESMSDVQQRVELFDVDKQKVLVAQAADVFLYSKVSKPTKATSPELHTVSYDTTLHQAQFCRWVIAD